LIDKKESLEKQFSNQNINYNSLNTHYKASMVLNKYKRLSWKNEYKKYTAKEQGIANFDQISSSLEIFIKENNILHSKLVQKRMEFSEQLVSYVFFFIYFDQII